LDVSVITDVTIVGVAGGIVVTVIVLRQVTVRVTVAKIVVDMKTIKNTVQNLSNDMERRRDTARLNTGFPSRVTLIGRTALSGPEGESGDHHVRRNRHTHCTQ
jgi:hypothetical protein